MTKQPLPEARPRSRSPSIATETAKAARAAPNVDPAEVDPDGGLSTGPTYPFPMRVLIGETIEQALATQQYFINEIDPNGGMEEMLVLSMVDHTRQLNLLENSKSIIVRMSLSERILNLMEPALDPADRINDEIKQQRLVNQWALGGNGAEEQIRLILKKLNIKFDHLLLNGYAVAFDKISHIDALIDRLERRRDRAIRTLEYTRANRPLVNLRHTQARRMNLALAGEESRYLIENASEVADRGG